MARAFERPATIALPESEGEGLALEGLFVPIDGSGRGGSLIAPPHPLMGGSMESPVVAELAFASERAGRSSLRFNWRGVGASGGRASGEIADADVDYASATAFLIETAPGPWMACGYSFGALAAIRAAERSPAPGWLLLVAPPTAMLDADRLARFPGHTLILAGQHDGWVDAVALSALAHDSERMRVEVIPRCDHFFMAGLGDISRLAGEWLSGLD